MKTIPLKPENTLFTDSQWQAIHDGGNNLLVSASAGSGKTMVLVKRVIEKIKQGVSVDELLVVTYTNAAAREMKERIQEAIQEEINAEPESDKRQHLVRQLPLLGHANISTLHSFCLKVIRRYYYLIDLDPVFRLLTDDTEITLMKEEVWDELLEELYGENDELFETLAASYSNDRSDDGLTELIFSLYNFSRANPEPKKWLKQLSQMYEVPHDRLEETFAYQKLAKPQMLQTLSAVIELITDSYHIGEGEEELEKVLETVEKDQNYYQSLNHLIEQDSLDEAFQLTQDFFYKRWASPGKKSTPEEVKETAREMKTYRDKAKDLSRDMVDQFFATSPSEQVELMSHVKKLTEEMARVTLSFSERFATYKAERKLPDFNDLEHLTLSILIEKNDEEWGPSEASTYYREAFKEVMVDEYQDINVLQENILHWLTKDEAQSGNQFMVGDVKQSIYGFRLADPGLFIEKYEVYQNGLDGERIILAENFRSRKDVLHFTNFLFIQLMDQNVGELTYDEAAKLINGFTAFPDSENFKPEILIYEKEEDEDEKEGEREGIEDLTEDFQIDSKTKGEILMVGEKILEMKQDGFEVYDKKTEKMRPISLNDIVLLTPTKKNNLVIQDVFKQLGISTAIKDTQNYFQTTEITLMMSLLKVIDNPRQDIPLVAVLRSPFVGLNEVDLTKIRIENKEASYYEAMITFVSKEMVDERNKQLQLKLEAFLNKLSDWREQARRKPLVELIWMIYQETGFLQYVGGMSSGKQRKANLHALYERAAAYEKTSFKGLFQFIRFIEKMQKKDKDLAEPASLSVGEEAVRVMTIHASKGLEFPIVFVLDMTKQFNQQELRKPYIFDEKFGVGTEYRHLEYRERKPTFPEQVLKNHKKKKLLSEEMRVLYVALTRSEQKLFLVGSYKNEETAWEKWGVVSGHKETVLPADLRLNASSFMDWVGMSVVRHELMDEESRWSNENKEVSAHPTRFSLSFYDQSTLENNVSLYRSHSEEEWYPKLKEGTLDTNDKEDVQESIQYALELMNMTYAHQVSTQTTSYQSVSEIKRLFEEPDDGQMVKIDVTNPRNQQRFVEDELERPQFISEDLKPSPAEIGQATHLVLQALDFTTQPTEDSVLEQVNQLKEKGILSEEMAPLIRVDQLVRFFETDFGQYVLRFNNQLKREVPFSLLMEAKEIFKDIGEVKDHVLIHGIVDGYIELDEGLVVFDYKTDQVQRFKERAGEEMLKKYRGQLTLYCKALESILDKPILNAYLVLLDTAEIIEVT